MFSLSRPRLICKGHGRSQQPGFTIMELLVVMALLVTVVTAVTQIFSSISRSQKKVFANQQLQSSVRFAMETMVREVHQGLIDYSYYTNPLAQTQTVLALRTPIGEAVRFRLNGSDLEVMYGSGSWAKLVSDTVRLINLKFYFAPLQDPLAVCADASCTNVPNSQPRVTIVLTAQSTSVFTEPSDAVYIQTTVTPRTYRR